MAARQAAKSGLALLRGLLKPHSSTLSASASYHIATPCSSSNLLKVQQANATWRPFASYGLAAQVVEYDVYRVAVVTGNVRGAGTHASAFLQLIGANGESERVIVGDSEENGFTRGSKREVEIAARKDIGPIKRVHVEREKGSICDVGDGWFLDRVEVHGPHNQEYVFPCQSWFGQSDCGNVEGPLDRNLIPAAPEVLETVVQRPVHVQGSGVSFPHPEKVLKNNVKGVNHKTFGYAGEDAYFVCYGKNNVFGMGVSDGVYMWKELGIDSGRFSRTLMETAQHMVAAGIEDVVRVFQYAARHVVSEGVLGSSTVCILTVNMEQGRLQAANLGDSGFVIFGKPQGSDKLAVKYRTIQMEHEFGCPYQLGHHAGSNKPGDAELVSVPVVKGDVVVMGSDGLLDNVSEADMLHAIEAHIAKGSRPNVIAQALGKMAYEASIDKARTTPYSEAASEAFDMVYSGGKPDDITVLVAIVD